MLNNRPLLSICVPTYNKAELLRSLLYCLAPQVAALAGSVELIVSDNASSDNTADVVEWAQQFGPIHYHCNSANIGAGRNFVQLAQQLAKGEYCWLIGDDDLVTEDGVAEVVKSLQAHPEIDCVYLNYASIVNDRGDGELIVAENFDFTNTMCLDLTTFVVRKWEEIILLTKWEGIFTYIGCHVLRTDLWKAQTIQFPDGIDFCSMSATFPHAYVAGLHMVGRPALYIGRPLVLLFIGTQDWRDWFPFLRLVRMRELGEFFASRGASRDTIRYYINTLFSFASYDYWKLTLRKGLPGSSEFRPWSYFRYAGHHKFWRMITLYPSDMYFKPALRRITSFFKFRKVCRRKYRA